MLNFEGWRQKGKKMHGYNNYPFYCLTGDVALIGDGACHEASKAQVCHCDGGDSN